MTLTDIQKQRFETILQRMLSRVTSKVDKREGAVIYDATAPAAMEFESVYFVLQEILKESFADTASREYLIRKGAERGLSPTTATNAILKACFDIDVPIGSRYSLDSLNYTVISRMDDICTAVDFYYEVECETVGRVGNNLFGKLVPIQYINGLGRADLVEVLVPGEDEEDTETFRERYFASFNNIAYGGNIADYKKKTLSIDGVGAVKVTPVWQGGGTVRVTILDAEFNPAIATLIADVQEILDPTPQGKGLGTAPIGHVVTVDSATQVTINLTADITLLSGYTISQLQGSIEQVISDYLLELRKQWAPSNELVASALIVRIAKIEAAILNVQGVTDIQNTKLNGGSLNIALGDYEIPIVGAVSIT